MVKIQHQFEQISNIPSRSWRACKNWFFMLTTFFARGIFSIHQIKKRSKKGPRPKNFCIQKSVMSCLSTKQRNFWSLYCILILFCQSVIWLPLFQFWKKISNLWFISYILPYPRLLWPLSNISRPLLILIEQLRFFLFFFHKRAIKLGP